MSPPEMHAAPAEAPPVPFNRAFRETFAAQRLTLGVFFPIEAFEGASPTMRGQVELARRAEALGFSALWFRDVPLLDPAFGDIGQVYDVWVYLATIAAHTTRIHLATGSVGLPLRHPLHTAKAAASVNELSGGRLILALPAAIARSNTLHSASSSNAAAKTSAMGSIFCAAPWRRSSR